MSTSTHISGLWTDPREIPEADLAHRFPPLLHAIRFHSYRTALYAIAGVFHTTHSPLLVQQMGKKPLLCFQTIDGETKIVPGEAHDSLQTWDGSPTLGDIFASGVLG
jgi:hypothetical protein